MTLAKEAGQNVITSSNDRIVPIVAGSVGPYGACQHDGSEYHGNYVDHMTSEELMEWHRPRVRELLASGADILACETIPAKVYNNYAQALAIFIIAEYLHQTRIFLCSEQPMWHSALTTELNDCVVVFSSYTMSCMCI